MIGEKSKEEGLFYYLRPEELIPEGHILRLIDKHVDFSFIREKVKDLYSHTGGNCRGLALLSRQSHLLRILKTSKRFTFMFSQLRKCENVP